MMDMIDHVARALLRHHGMSDEDAAKADLSNREEHRIAGMFVAMHEAMRHWFSPPEPEPAPEPPDPVEASPAEDTLPTNPPDPQPVEEPQEDAGGTVDHADSDSVEPDSDPEDHDGSVTSES